MLDNLLVIDLNVIIHLLHDSFYKLWGIRLLEGLMKVYDIAYHLSMECNWVTHWLLKSNLPVMV